MSWEGPDPWRDEDRYYEDSSMVPVSLHGPEIGSDAWTAAEIAAGRSGEEIDRSLMGGVAQMQRPRHKPRVNVPVSNPAPAQ